MIEFNIRWLFILVGFTSILLGFLLLILKKSSSNIEGPAHWAAASFSMGVGLIIFALYPWPFEYSNLILTNLLLACSNSLILIGIRKFKDKKVNRLIVFGIPFLSLLLNTVFILLWVQPGLRIASNSSIYAVYGFLIVYEMLFPHQKEYKYIFRINAISFMFFGLVMILRAVFSKWLSHFGVMGSNNVNLAILVLATILQAVLTYGFIIMVNIRVAEDLKKQILIRDKFLSIIAHDLKNQINIIGGFSELLHSSIGKQNIEKSFQFSGYIRQAAIQVTGLLNNLLEWARLQNKSGIFHPEKVNLAQIIQEEIDSNYVIAQNKQIEIGFNQPEQPVIAFADRNMVKTIIRNLIINAVKFTNMGGTIQIQIIDTKDLVEISVTDSGIGIKPEVMKMLFHTNSMQSTEGTNNESGHGIGLLLCKEFVEKHGGKIWVESVFELGSSFKFTLPCEEKSGGNMQV